MWDAEKIKALRRRFGETQIEFCERVGVSHGMLRAWERGALLPRRAEQKLLTAIHRDPSPDAGHNLEPALARNY